MKSKHKSKKKKKREMQKSDVRLWVEANQETMPMFYNTGVESIDDAIHIIEEGNVSHISLDYELGLELSKYIAMHAENGGYRFGLQMHAKSSSQRAEILENIKLAMRSWAEGKKSDIIKVDNSIPSWFAVMALCLDSKNNGTPKLEAPDGILKIDMTVNGRKISFADAVEEVYNRLVAHVDEKAAKIAHEKVCAKFLRLEETLGNANALVRNKIFEEFGVDVGEERVSIS